MNEEKQIDVDEFFGRLVALYNNGQLCVVNCDEGEKVISEIWKINRMEEIFPVLKILTEEEKKKLKLDGEKPSRINNDKKQLKIEMFVR